MVPWQPPLSRLQRRFCWTISRKAAPARGTEFSLALLRRAYCFSQTGVGGVHIMAKNSANLGVAGGKLRPCPDTPNCVCSMDHAAAHHVEPLAFRDDPDNALSRLKAVLADQTRTRLVAEEADYLHAECMSLVFR